jgi:hypothetical protein
VFGAVGRLGSIAAQFVNSSLVSNVHLLLIVTFSFILLGSVLGGMLPAKLTVGRGRVGGGGEEEEGELPLSEEEEEVLKEKRRSSSQEARRDYGTVETTEALMGEGDKFKSNAL